MYISKSRYVFYTETKEGIETIVGTKECKHPSKIKLYKDMQKKGFVNGIHLYGFRLISNIQSENIIDKLKSIKSVRILSITNQFISIKFALKDKRDIIILLNGLSISTHTQDGLTTGTIQIF